MSDISTLSKRYNNLKEISEGLNEAVMLLKKHQVLSQKKISGEHDKLILSDEEIDSARREVLEFLLDINLFLSDEEYKGDQFTKPVGEKIITKLKSEFNLFEKTLGSLLKAISKSSLLDDSHFELLNKLLATIDSERARTFRKLRTSRR